MAGRLEVVSRSLGYLGRRFQLEGFSLYPHPAQSHRRAVHLVLGLSANREVEIIDPLLPLARQVFAVESQNSRNGVIPAAELTEYVRSRGILAECAELAQVPALLKSFGPVCVCGSLYLIGDVQALIMGGDEGNRPTKA